MVQDRPAERRWEEHTRGMVYRTEWKYKAMTARAGAGHWWMLPIADWGVEAAWVSRTEQWLIRNFG